MNTYAWIQATADSRIVNNKGTGIDKAPIKGDILVNAFPRSDIRRCPAIKLAVNRTHKVMGRIIFLTSSIITINIIRAAGVPCGTRWDSMWFVFFNQPNSIKDNQKISDNGNVTVRWEVGEKICGYKAKKFITKIMENTIIIIVSLPFSFLLSVNLTSFLKVETNFFVISSIGYLEFHILIV